MLSDYLIIITVMKELIKSYFNNLIIYFTLIGVTITFISFEYNNIGFTDDCNNNVAFIFSSKNVCKAINKYSTEKCIVNVM